MKNKYHFTWKKACHYSTMLLVCVLLAGCGKDTTKELLSSLSEEKEVSESQDILDTQGEQTGQGGQTALQEDSRIFVHVCGAVKEPRVYELPFNCRFFEAVEIAGGFREDACAEYLNMASILQDGARLEIPTYTQVREASMAGMVIAPDGTMSTGASSESGLININTADAALLCTLPGIGQSRADSIIAYREEQGAFVNKEDIMNVAGIKEGMYRKIADLIDVE